MKKKVTITSLHLQHGGVEMAISLLANALCARQYAVEILCTYQLGQPAYPLDERVKVTYLTDDHPNREEFAAALHSKNPAAILREGIYALGVLQRKKKTMKRALQQVAEGTVISTRHEHSLLLSRYGRSGVKKIAQLHSDHHFNSHLIRDMRRGYRHIDVFVLLAEPFREEVSSFLEGYNTHTRCIVIPNFLHDVYLGQPHEKTRQVLAVGRLHPDKGFDRLLDVWKLVAPSHPDWCLKIIGGGELEPMLKEKAASLGIQDRVVFTGPLPHDEVLREMEISSVYAMTSVSEAFPFVLVEAMSRYLPVVAYDVRIGPRVIIDDGIDGFLAEDGQPEAFSQKLSFLMDDPSLCRTMAAHAAEKANCFTEDAVMEKWMDIL